MPKRVPSYRHHKATGQAFIELQGRRRYLGKHGTPASKRLYSQVLAEYLAGQVTPLIDFPKAPITVDELIHEFWQHVKARYVKNGKPTSERNRFKVALKAVRSLYGRTPAREFGPLKLVVVRNIFLERAYCRKQINLLVSRIRRCWKWGVGRELVPETTWRALLAIEGLRKGEARDELPVEPVRQANIDAVQAHLSPILWAMVQFQLFTGCRPGEVCGIRMCDLKMNGDVWEFRPGTYKTEHHEGLAPRVIFIGPKAQDVLRPFLRTETQIPLFSPRDSRDWYLSLTRRQKRTPVARPKVKPGDLFTTNSYGQAIRGACRKAKIECWAPNQLRHSAATLVRAEFGLESSRVVMGHASAVTTEIYAEVDAEKAREIMRRIG